MTAPDYYQHEEIYRQIRSAGGSGWQDTAGDAELWALCEPLLKSASAAAADGGAALDDEALIEVGCGAGNLTAHLVRAGYRVSGVDISPTAVAWARERLAELRLSAALRVGNALDLAGWPDGSFDVAVDSLCWHCIIGCDRQRFLSAVRRVLRPGGRLIILTMCNDPQPPGLWRLYDAGTRCLMNGQTPNRYLGTETDLLAELRGGGFRLLRTGVRYAPPGSADQHMLLAVAQRPGGPG